MRAKTLTSMAHQDSSTPLHTWYHSVTSRNVDLVGDFAGSNLGAIEGTHSCFFAFQTQISILDRDSSSYMPYFLLNASSNVSMIEDATSL